MDTDYLVVGAGALGMAFVDTLVDRTDADVVMIDRRQGPGGHWLDAYPFVQLHQPSMNYGVNSTTLGQDRREPEGPDAGFYERAGGTEICGYYDEVMRHRLLASGRVRFVPMADHLGDGRFRSRVTGAQTAVTVRRAVVDATYMSSRVPGSEAPPFDVAPGVRCVPVGALTDLREPPDGYVIVGAGKTAMDAVCWLFANGVAPDDITWIRPREPWVVNRRYFQPGEGVLTTFDGIVRELEAVVECADVDEVFDRLEAQEFMWRLDPGSRPTMLKGATVSRSELDQLRRVERVVRLGHVRAIGPEAITLEGGSILTTPDCLHVHCASAGLADNPPRPIFGDGSLLLQPITRVNLCLSAGLIAAAEASGRATADKNRLLPPNPWFDTAFDWLRHLLTGMRTELGWQDAPELTDFLDTSRLNLMKGLDDDPDKQRVMELQGRFLTALFPALAKLETFAAHATAAERARMFAPTG
jgi:hypothetical protein